MIKNMMGEMVEFDLVEANKLTDCLKKWIEDGNLLPYELSALVFSVWGYEAALEEIKYLRKELDKFKRVSLFEFDSFDLPDDYYENEAYSDKR
jgi:hypothetical protein